MKTNTKLTNKKNILPNKYLKRLNKLQAIESLNLSDRKYEKGKEILYFSNVLMKKKNRKPTTTNTQ